MNTVLDIVYTFSKAGHLVLLQTGEMHIELS